MAPEQTATRKRVISYCLAVLLAVALSVFLTGLLIIFVLPNFKAPSTTLPEGFLGYALLLIGMLSATVVYLSYRLSDYRYLQSQEQQRAVERESGLQEQLDRARRMESVGLLAAGVAHDLNNVMGPLVAYPELILMQLPDDSPVRDEVTAISNSARRAAGIVHDLLALSRRGRYAMQPTDINTVVQEYLHSADFHALHEEHANISVQYRPDPDIHCLQGSDTHLGKIVLNLIINAFEAMPDGGTLTIATMDEQITELPGGYANLTPGCYVVLSVRDTGSGIAPEDISSVFEPYFSKKTLGRSGSGLGLSVVYGILKDHHGYYDVLSTPGKGTEFRLYFPAIAETVAQDCRKSHLASGTETILILDDEQEQREVAGSLLQALGYRVHTAANRVAALELQQAHHPDLVVLDMILDNSDSGLAVYEELLRVCPSQKAIIVSGFASDEKVQKAQALGAGTYLRKPYTQEDIACAVRHELDRKSSRPVPCA